MDTHEDSLLIDRSIIRLTPSITFMRNHFYTNSFVDLDYRCTRIDLRPFPKIETTPPFNSHCKSFLKNNRNFPSGIWINTREIFHTISHKKNSTDRSFSFSIQNKYTCVRSEHFEQLDHEYKPTTVRLPSRKNESTTLPLLLLLPPPHNGVDCLSRDRGGVQWKLTRDRGRRAIQEWMRRDQAASLSSPSLPPCPSRKTLGRRGRRSTRSLPVDFSLFREIPRIESRNVWSVPKTMEGKGIIYHSMEWFLKSSASSNASTRFVRFRSIRFD